MKIIPNQKFRHDGQTYEEGVEYDVDGALAFYFTNVGWVGDDNERANKNHGAQAIDLGMPIVANMEVK